MFIIKTKKQYNLELKEAYEKGRCEQQEVGWRNDEITRIHDSLGKICDRLERLENKGRKRRFHCPLMPMTGSIR